MRQIAALQLKCHRPIGQIQKLVTLIKLQYSNIFWGEALDSLDAFLAMYSFGMRGVLGGIIGGATCMWGERIELSLTDFDRPTASRTHIIICKKTFESNDKTLYI